MSENLKHDDVDAVEEDQNNSTTAETTDTAEEETKKEEAVSEIDKMTAELEEMKDKYLRLSAEYDNYRKRTIKEKMELSSLAKIDLIKDILPVIDDFERALPHMTEAVDVASLREGVDLIYKKFMDFLGKQGVSTIETQGLPFDTDVHEAITKMPAPSPEMKGKVLDCVEKGYKLNDKVIRFSKVVVCE